MLATKRTALFALVLAILGAVQGFDMATLISDPQMVGWVGTGIGVIIFGLRAITNAPMFSKKLGE